MTASWKEGGLLAGLIVAAHGLLALLPSPPLAGPENLVLCATNLYVLYCAGAVLKGRSAKTLLVFLAGYAALFVFLLVIAGKKPLFILLVILYASVFGSPLLLGFFALFVLSFVLLQPYAFETFLPLSCIWAALWRARRSASRFALICLGGGLVALCVVLLPVLHLALEDSAQTLWHTLERAEVREALAVSLVSSTLATLLVAMFGVPLAYALARVAFPGKRAVETAVDLPILVPQSVTGIALLSFLGPGSPLGEALERLGLPLSGSMLGIIAAQVFVAAPFLIKTAMTAFEGVPVELELASRSLGVSPAGTFARIALPLAGRGVLTGIALAWGRAISELGCLLLFAPTPVSAPVQAYTEFLRAGTSESRPIAVLLLATCVWIFVGLSLGSNRSPFLRWRAHHEA